MDEATERLPLIQVAKQSAEVQVKNFDQPGEDIINEMMCQDAKGQMSIMALMVDMSTNQERILTANMMTCQLAVLQAVQATFCFTVWSIPPEAEDQWVADGRPAPADFPGHAEEIFIFHVSRDGEALHRALLTRHEDGITASLGEWREQDEGHVVGMFRQALYLGIHLGSNIPDEMAQDLRKQMDEEGAEKTLAMMIGGLRNAIDMASRKN
jgi:hypothetical protein